MNIHEIIALWDRGEMPQDLSVLAAMQSKVEDYLKQAREGYNKSKRQAALDAYWSEIVVYNAIVIDVETAINKAIPEPQ